ncbi:MAG: hypothetical protein EHM58_02260 [Ignavibacteriae bacterium]|nr:MAG: hypothetical protein EHM58_02260 [Ignavibacteriota bacterium]
MIKIKSIPITKIKIPVPNVYQESDYSCGAAALVSIINYYSDIPVNEKFVSELMNLDDSGSDPYQIINAVRKIGLKYKEYRRMTISRLKRCIDARKTVMIMVQAWGDKRSYELRKKDCKNGHWLVAIGYDKDNIYFEDPSLNRTIGYIKIKELDARWYDKESYGPNDKTIHFSDHYGVAIWGRKSAKPKIKAREIM